MGLIENIRNKTREEKIRLIWIIAATAAILLSVLWVLTSKISKDLPKDTTLFETLDKGIRDIRENFRK